MIEHEILDAIANINGTINDFADNEQQHVYMESNGSITIVKFLGCTIFNSQDDDRDYDEEKDCITTPIERYLICKMTDCINMAINTFEKPKENHEY